jgi:hypothetical protein
VASFFEEEGIEKSSGAMRFAYCRPTSAPYAGSIVGLHFIQPNLPRYNLSSSFFTRSISFSVVIVSPFLAGYVRIAFSK